MKNEKDEIGRRIRLLRLEHGYTIETLAEKAGLSARFLAAEEAGRKGTSSSTIIKLAAALHATTDYLLFGSKRQEETIELPLTGISAEKRKTLQEIFLKAIELCDGPRNPHKACGGASKAGSKRA